MADCERLWNALRLDDDEHGDGNDDDGEDAMPTKRGAFAC